MFELLVFRVVRLGWFSVVIGDFVVGFVRGYGGVVREGGISCLYGIGCVLS